MAEDVSEDMIRAAYRQGGAGNNAILVTIASAHLPETIRFTNREGGLTSRGDEFRYVPFSFSFPGASADQPSRECEIEFGRSADVALGIKSAPKNTVVTATVEMVKATAPDQVERAFRKARVGLGGLQGPSIRLTLKSRSFATEFACSKRYLMSRTPGLFGAQGVGT